MSEEARMSSVLTCHQPRGSTITKLRSGLGHGVGACELCLCLYRFWLQLSAQFSQFQPEENSSGRNISCEEEGDTFLFSSKQNMERTKESSYGIIGN